MPNFNWPKIRELESLNFQKDLIISKRKEMLNDIIKTLNSSITYDCKKYKLQEEEKYKSWLKKLPLLGDF